MMFPGSFRMKIFLCICAEFATLQRRQLQQKYWHLRERGPCRKSVQFPFKLTFVLHAPVLFYSVSNVLGIWKELARALPSFRRRKPDSSLTLLASLALGWGTWEVDMFATWSDYKLPCFLARILLQGGINWFPMAQSLLLVVLGFF